ASLASPPLLPTVRDRMAAGLFGATLPRRWARRTGAGRQVGLELVRRRTNCRGACPLETTPCRDLLDSLRERRCVLFVGAGLSKGAGLPDWGGLLHELARDLGLNAAALPRDAHGQLALDLCLDLAQWHADRFGRQRLDERLDELFGRSAAGTRGLRP